MFKAIHFTEEVDIMKDMVSFELGKEIEKDVFRGTKKKNSEYP